MIFLCKVSCNKDIAHRLVVSIHLAREINKYNLSSNFGSETIVDVHAFRCLFKHLKRFSAVQSKDFLQTNSVWLFVKTKQSLGVIICHVKMVICIENQKTCTQCRENILTDTVNSDVEGHVVVRSHVKYNEG